MFGSFFGNKELQLHPNDLKEKMDKGEDLLILDVREGWEHARVKIPKAMHIPLAQLPQKLSEIDRDRDIVVYCHHGVRSLQACHFLKKMGFEKVRNLYGGIDAYANHVDRSMLRY
jgi:adenylyltransferase/sulfurtransferase